jgi:pre-mRNA-processing factor 40
LVQHRYQAEFLGNARCLQESSRHFRNTDNTGVGFTAILSKLCIQADCLRTPAGFPPSTNNGGFFDHQRDQRDIIPESRQLSFASDPKAQTFVPASNEPDYATAEEAEAAFVKLLRRSGVQPDWSWEDTLRVIVKDSQYRAIKDPKDRKAAFEKFCHDILVQDKERAKERLGKLRADFAIMLRSHPEIKHYTRWKTARPMIEGETIFRSTNNEDERRQLFSDYVADLKKAHREQQATQRKSAIDSLIDLLPKLNLEPYSRWSDAQKIISSTTPFQTDDKFKTLSKLDVLNVFQNHMKALERTFNDSRQEEKRKKYRAERQSRDAYKILLGELRRDGKIKAGSKWSQIYPVIENDDRYKNVVGQSGSKPMELFWDVVEEEERALRGTRNDVEDVIDVSVLLSNSSLHVLISQQDKRFEVTPKTTFESFFAVMRDDRRTANIDRDILTLIFERVSKATLAVFTMLTYRIASGEEARETFRRREAVRTSTTSGTRRVSVISKEVGASHCCW